MRTARIVGIDGAAMSRARAVAAVSAPAPGGFRRDPNGVGLFVPTELSRKREVITKDEWKALDRAIRKVLGPKEIKFILACGHLGCPDPKIVRLRQPDGGFILRCGHADRVFSPSI